MFNSPRQKLNPTGTIRTDQPPSVWQQRMNHEAQYKLTVGYEGEREDRRIYVDRGGEILQQRALDNTEFDKSVLNLDSLTVGGRPTFLNHQGHAGQAPFYIKEIVPLLPEEDYEGAALTYLQEIGEGDGIDPDDIQVNGAGSAGLRVVYPGGEFLVCALEEEADREAIEHIKESVWAFKYSFLASHSSAIRQLGEELFRPVQDACERANEGIWAMLDDPEEFVRDAIRADGRGHFLNPEDGEEHEVKYEGITFFLYDQ